MTVSEDMKYYFRKIYFIYLFLILLPNASVSVMGGILKGLFQQNAAFVWYFISYLIVQIPLAYYLGIYLDWQLMGIWDAKFVSSVLAFVSYFVMIWRVNYTDVYKQILQQIEREENSKALLVLSQYN